MKTTTSCKIAGILAIALACSAGPAAATVKPAALDASLAPLVLVQQPQEQAQDQSQKRGKKAQKKKMTKEQQGMERAKKHLPPEYHQYLQGGATMGR